MISTDPDTEADNDNKVYNDDTNVNSFQSANDSRLRLHCFASCEFCHASVRSLPLCRLLAVLYAYGPRPTRCQRPAAQVNNQRVQVKVGFIQ